MALVAADLRFSKRLLGCVFCEMKWVEWAPRIWWIRNSKSEVLPSRWTCQSIFDNCFVFVVFIDPSDSQFGKIICLCALRTQPVDAGSLISLLAALFSDSQPRTTISGSVGSTTKRWAQTKRVACCVRHFRCVAYFTRNRLRSVTFG